jgi:hypothetical protein
MAYTNPKYKITMATKSGSIAYLYLTENDSYSGLPYQFPAVSIELQYLPKSDDIFESIVSSQLSATIDVTDDTTGQASSNMPNLTTLDDRKYLAQLYYDSTLEWQGWAISDNVQFNFSTGRKTIAFNAIDGLGMLESIYYPLPTNYSLADKVLCLQFINQCLAQIQFPTGLNIVSGISYYAGTMNNRSTSSANEPLNQSYLKYNTFVDNNNLITTTSNIKITTNCLSILSQICKGFGAKLFQAEGKWFIIAINEFAQTSFYYTEYNTSYSVVSSGTRSVNGQIQGFAGNTSGLFFVDNGQYKIYRKGYNKIVFNKTIDYNSNYITNFDLKNFTGNVANSWTNTQIGTGGTIILKDYPQISLNSFVLSLNTYKTSVAPINVPSLSKNESATLSFDVNAIGAANGPIAICYVRILLTTASNTYYLDNTNKWTNEFTKNYKGLWNAATNTPTLHNGTGTAGDTYLCNVAGVNNFLASNYSFNIGDLAYYDGSTWSAKPGYNFVPYNGNSTANASIQFASIPDNGDISIEFILSQGAAYTGYSREPFYTQAACEIQNFQLQLSPNYKSLLTEAYVSNSLEYNYTANITLGFNDYKSGYYNYKGFLCDSSGLSLSGWYRYEYPTEIYNALSELVIKQYLNSFSNNLINIDSSIMGMNTNTGRFSGAMRLTATDTDPSQINVSSKSYMVGNTTIDLFNNTIKTTLLDINSSNLDSYSLQTKYFTNNLHTTNTGYGHLRSSAYATREAAYAAPLTTNLIYNNTTGAPSVGDRYYTDENLISGFNGANLWWRVMNDVLSYHAYKISSSGYILEIYG